MDQIERQHPIEQITKLFGDIEISPWSHQVDPSIQIAALDDLESRLDLPDGWSYEVRQLDSELRVETIGREAQVLQDEYRNSYSLVAG